MKSFSVLITLSLVLADQFMEINGLEQKPRTENVTSRKRRQLEVLTQMNPLTALSGGIGVGGDANQGAARGVGGMFQGMVRSATKAMTMPVEVGLQIARKGVDVFGEVGAKMIDMTDPTKVFGMGSKLIPMSTSGGTGGSVGLASNAGGMQSGNGGGIGVVQTGPSEMQTSASSTVGIQSTGSAVGVQKTQNQGSQTGGVTVEKTQQVELISGTGTSGQSGVSGMKAGSGLGAMSGLGGTMMSGGLGALTPLVGQAANAVQATQGMANVIPSAGASI